MRPRRPGDAELNEVARRRLALIGQELDRLRPAPTDEEAASDQASDAGREPGPDLMRASVVPETGRHRSDATSTAARWRAWVPDSLQGRVRLAPQHVALVAVVVAVALAATTWWVLRAAGEKTDVEWAAPSVPSGGLVEDAGTPPATPDPSSDEAEETTEESATVVVHVAGRVRRPGIVTLPLGSRVADALEAAGGARRRVHTGTVNLARVLVDGEQILVGERAAATPGSATSADSATPPGGPAAGPVNLNTATAAELETLSGVGPVTAQAILAWREEHGRFSAIEELLEVSGIGEKTLAVLAPHVTL